MTSPSDETSIQTAAMHAEQRNRAATAHGDRLRAVERAKELESERDEARAKLATLDRAVEKFLTDASYTAPWDAAKFGALLVRLNGALCDSRGVPAALSSPSSVAAEEPTPRDPFDGFTLERGRVYVRPEFAPPAAEETGKETRNCWGWASDSCSETWSGPFATREEAIAAGRAESNGDGFAIGLGLKLDPAELIEGFYGGGSSSLADQILEEAEEGRPEECGWADEPVFKLKDQDAALSALAVALGAWAREHVTTAWPGMFYMTDDHYEEIPPPAPVEETTEPTPGPGPGCSCYGGGRFSQCLTCGGQFAAPPTTSEGR